MGSEKFEIRIPAVRVLIAMLILITPICVLGLFALTQGTRSVEQAVGNNFRLLAEAGASEVSRFIHDRVTDVGVMAMEFSIVDAVEAANKERSGKSDDSSAAEIQKIEAMWNTPEAQPIVNRILSSRASQMLRKHKDFDRRFLRITVTDAAGATAAATHKTLDYYQADEDFWQGIYAEGRGSVSITDVLYDDVTKSHYIGIGVPILEPQTNRFMGVVDALVDVSAIFAVVQRTPSGTSARSMLVKDDGTIIAAPGIDLSMKARSDQYMAVLESQEVGKPSGYLVAGLRDGRHLIGFANTGLRQDYGSLGWHVVTSQSATEAMAPVRSVVRLLLLMSVLGLLAVILFAVWVYLHRETTYEHLEVAETPQPGQQSASA